MSVKIAINGFGRIGRSILRAVFENSISDFEVVAINDLAPIETLAHLLRYDSIHGRFNHKVETSKEGLIINDKLIRATSIRVPSELPWTDVDIALECTGLFCDRAKASMLLEAGAKRVLISAPGNGVDKTIVYGVNHQILTQDDLVVSNGSCTTNCLAPIAKVLNDLVGIETGYMTTIHAYTGDQPTHDVEHKDLYRGRAAAMSMIPTTTGAAKAISLVLPELEGRIDGSAIRVPTPNVSLIDLTFMTAKKTTVAEIDNAMLEASTGSLKNVLAFDDAPKVSIDFNHTCTSSNYAQPQTVITEGGMVRVVSWYDNEWGFANRMIDTAQVMAERFK